MQMSRVRFTSLMGRMLSLSKEYSVELDPSFVSVSQAHGVQRVIHEVMLQEGSCTIGFLRLTFGSDSRCYVRSRRRRGATLSRR